MTRRTVNEFTVEEMTDFPPNSNPYHYDLYNMGQAVGAAGESNIEVMYDKFNPDSFIVVHKPTGKRICIVVPS